MNILTDTPKPLRSNVKKYLLDAMRALDKRERLEDHNPDRLLYTNSAYGHIDRLHGFYHALFNMNIIQYPIHYIDIDYPSEIINIRWEESLNSRHTQIIAFDELEGWE